VPVPKPTGDVLRGKVTLRGTKPDLARLTADVRAATDKNADKDFCLGGSPEEVAQQTWQIDARGGVGNVFVWIEPAEAGAFFRVSEQDLARAKGPVVLRQPSGWRSRCKPKTRWAGGWGSLTPKASQSNPGAYSRALSRPRWPRVPPGTAVRALILV
jgi:hypothetical protein